LQLWIEREVIASRLNVIGFKAQDAQTYDLRDLFHMINQIKAQMHIHILITGKHNQEIEDDIASALTHEGFKLSPDREKADVLISGSVKTELLALDKPDWKFIRAKVFIDIIDAMSDTVVGQVSHQTRKGRLNQREAEYQAVKVASRAVAQKLVDFFSLGS